MKARVHLLTVLVVDHERMSDEAMEQIIENTRHAYPTVISHASREVEWDDSHPLNHRNTQQQALADLFGAEGQREGGEK